MLRERYETLYGIYNHDAPDVNRPLASVAIHKAEDASLGSLLYERIEQFEERKIYQRFGISLVEFLELPSDVCLKIMEIAGKRLTEEGTMTASVMNQLSSLERR